MCLRILHSIRVVNFRPDISNHGGPSGLAVCGRSPAVVVGSNPTRTWMFVCCECFVLSCKGLCDGLITRPDESYRLCCVVVCDIETARVRMPWPTGGCCPKTNNSLSVISVPFHVLLLFSLTKDTLLTETCSWF
jgi:hypothetical protein